MNKQFIKDGVGWGIGLWLIGYVLGIVLFAVVSPNIIGWVIMPIGLIITLWVLFKKVHPAKFMPQQNATESQFGGVKGATFRYFLSLAVVWTLIAIDFDYFFLVKVFNPADGYYKLDVYIYYVLTFLLPLFVGWRRLSHE
jgi:hypothetical protein